MSNPDRGAYTPPTADAPLSFDARQPVRGARPAPMMLIVSALVLVVLVIAIVIFYRSGVHEAGGLPQAVGTPVGAVKTAPPAEAQPVDPVAGLQIYQSTDGQAPPAAPNFTAPPEQPQARIPTPTVVTAPPAQPNTPTTTVVAPPAAKPAPAQPTAPVAAQPIAAQPAPKPAAPAAKPAATPAPTAAVSGAALVQIGAFSSAAQAEKGLADAARIAPGAIAGKGKKVEPIQKDGSTLYRTSVTGFASRADAQAFCDKLKAAGKSCFVK